MTHENHSTVMKRREFASLVSFAETSQLMKKKKHCIVVFREGMEPEIRNTPIRETSNLNQYE